MNTPLDPRDSSAQQQHLERLIGQVLRQQPLRTAPRSLEARVLAAIEQRVSLPWWRSSFMHWPIGIRVVFLLASIGVIKGALAAVMWLVTEERSAPVVNAVSRPLSWAESISDIWYSIANISAAIVHAMPATWLYAGIGLAVALYMALFLLSATAYRTLYVNK